MNYENNQESEEIISMLEKDKEKRESEKIILIKEQKLLNERKSIYNFSLKFKFLKFLFYQFHFLKFKLSKIY